MTDIVRLSKSFLKRGLLVSTVFVLCGFATSTTLDPDGAEFVTSDVDHFWRAFDDAAKARAADRVHVYAREYMVPGSQGLKDFIAYRHLTPEKFAEHVEENRDYYTSIRPLIGQVVGKKPVIRMAFRRLKDLYPDMKFPRHVYFVVGAQHGAGMNSDNGIILAAEMFATPSGSPYSYTKVSPEYVPFSAVHETIHFNQVYEANDHSTLLESVVNEGTADFVASLVLPEPAVRQSTDRWQYGCLNEAALDDRFMRDEDSTKTSPWLFDHTPDTGWPPDMGYWLGYRIAQTFYDQAVNKTEALRTLMKVTDFKAFVAASGYPRAKPPCTPARPLHTRSAKRDP